MPDDRKTVRQRVAVRLRRTLARRDLARSFGFLISLFSVLCSLSFSAEAAFDPLKISEVFGKKKPVLIRVFHSPACKACQKVIRDILPELARKYEPELNWVYLDITQEQNYKQYLELEKIAARPLGTPTILIGDKVRVGIYEISDSLDADIALELKTRRVPLLLTFQNIDILERFKDFKAWAVVGAGLVDGINPCAFTVIVFFVSFLNFMGYRRRELAFIGAAYILAVFLTYIALGLGLFKAFYSLKMFYLLSKIVYMSIGFLSICLGGFAVKDYLVYKKTGNTGEMALKLPKSIKNKIQQIVGNYYRKDKTGQAKALNGLLASAMIVGFMVSLLEAVCTGQVYLPTIIFVLKDPVLRARAFFFLVVYNLMFILPLVLVLFLALRGTSSKQFEEYARRHLGLIKLAMAAVFFSLGAILWIGV